MRALTQRYAQFITVNVEPAVRLCIAQLAETTDSQYLHAAIVREELHQRFSAVQHDLISILDSRRDPLSNPHQFLLLSLPERPIIFRIEDQAFRLARFGNHMKVYVVDMLRTQPQHRNERDDVSHSSGVHARAGG